MMQSARPPPPRPPAPPPSGSCGSKSVQSLRPPPPPPVNARYTGDDAAEEAELVDGVDIVGRVVGIREREEVTNPIADDSDSFRPSMPPMLSHLAHGNAVELADGFV